MISVENITKSYGSLKVLKGINLNISQGEIISIVGASGAGKTTFLHILGTLEKPDTGRIYYNGKDVFNFRDKQKSAFRNKEIGFVFQFHHLLPEFTALENIMLPSLIAGNSKKDAEKKAEQLADYLGLSDRKTNKPSQMSGGEQQRVAVARALINEPKVLLADEPSGNLDSRNADDLHKLLLKLRDDLNQIIVIVTHNNKLADIADRKMEINDGVFV